MHQRRHSIIWMFLTLLTAGVLTGVAVVRNSPESDAKSSRSIVTERNVIGPVVVPLVGPLTVAVQPGHWKIDELPAEARRRERGPGAIHGEIREIDINLAVVDALVPLLEDEGWKVLVIPATVPPGLRTDAFISVHADWGGDPDRRGWKLAPPWRPSLAASDLAASLREAFLAEPALVEDVGGITVGMRGYFGFSSSRYIHASSPYTPAVLLELGFVTNAIDSELMLSRPEFYAAIIHRGLVNHFARWDRKNVWSLIPRLFSTLRVAANGAVVHRLPDAESNVLRRLEPGELIWPVDERDGWIEARFRNPNQIGWVSKAMLSGS